MDNFKNRAIVSNLEISNKIEKVFFSELSYITNYYNIFCLAFEDDVLFGFSVCVPLNYVDEKKYKDISYVIDNCYSSQSHKVKSHILQKLDPLRKAALNIEDIAKNTNYAISKINNFSESKLTKFYDFCNVSKKREILELMNLGVCKKDIYKSLIFKLDYDKFFVDDFSFNNLIENGNLELSEGEGVFIEKAK